MQCAIFVDAGYLFAQGSSAVYGEKKRRDHLALNGDRAIQCLTEVMKTRAPAARLLRIYWYDGAGYGGPTSQQFDLAYRNDVKLRLGFLSSSGQQRGVDSLIVTDLIDLARNRAISDAVLLSGDEDVRVGVHIAQSHGVRVHLLGIAPSRGSQSQLLLQEADTTTEWTSDNVAAFLSLITTESILPESIGEVSSSPTHAGIASPPDPIADCAKAIARELNTTESSMITRTGPIPQDLDGRLLRAAAIVVGRMLEPAEKLRLRKEFKAAVENASAI